eukprot:604975-Hanusia_phi.AAC.1
MLQAQYDDVLRSESQSGVTEELAEQFDVSLNPDVNPSTVEDGGESDMALAFLNIIDKDSGAAKVIGYSEFPFTNGGKMKQADWTIEREYWLQLDRTAQRQASGGGGRVCHPARELRGRLEEESGGEGPVAHHTAEHPAHDEESEARVSPQ